MKLSEQMRIKQWLDRDSAAYVKAVVAIWTDRVVVLEAVAEAADNFLDALDNNYPYINEASDVLKASLAAAKEAGLL